MDCQNLVFSRHAIQQMFLRRISKRDVQAVVAYGEVVEENPEDTPFSSYLLLDFVEGKPLHDDLPAWKPHPFMGGEEGGAGYNAFYK